MIPDQPSNPPEPFADDPARFLRWAARAAKHDLANQLLAIEWCGSLLEESDGPDGLGEAAREIAEAVGRARESLAFLALLTQSAPGRFEARSLMEHATSLITLAVGSEMGVELNLRRCDPCRLATDAGGFVQALTRLAVYLAESGRGGILEIEAQTLRVAGKVAGPPRLMVSLRRRWRSGEQPPTEVERVPAGDGAGSGADARIVGLAAYLERRLGGQLLWEAGDGAWGRELRVVVPAEEQTARGGAGAASERFAGGGRIP